MREITITLDPAAYVRGLARFTRGNWLSITSIAIGLATSCYFYGQSREERDLVFTEQGRTEVITSDRVSIAPLRVVRADGRPITGDVTALQFYVWNAGKRPIRAGDVLEPVTLGFADSTVHLLDYRVLKASRSVVQPTIRQVVAGNRPAVELGFRILEQGDGFAGQIIFEGHRTAPLSVRGVVEGVSEIRRHESVGTAGLLLGALAPFVIAIGVLLVLLFALVIAVGLVEPALQKYLSPSARRRLWLAARIALGGAIASLLVMIVVLSYRERKERAAAGAATEVPDRLRLP